MGSRISIIRNRSSRAVDERFTRPQRLIRQPSNVDYKKLRKLILSQKLAPCFEGVEDSSPDLEECPICFFFYPSLNRSRCCMKGICTECFLQMKPSNVTDRPTQCPFCKYSSYAVEYRGAKTEEEKSLEQAEEQKVIEAKIRMQSQGVNRVTLADCISSEVEARSPVLLFRPLSSIIGDAQDFRHSEIPLEEERTRTSQIPFPNNSNERPEEFDLDLEEIMMTEAISRSIQDAGQSCGVSGTVESRSSGHESNQSGLSSALVGQGEPSSESVTAELAVAIARMAELSIRWPETLDLIQENNDQADQPIEEAGHTGPLMGPEFDEMQSEDGCLESYSLTTDDDSWGLLAASILEEKQGSESGFVSGEDLAADVADNGSCSSSSSVHSLSDGSAESSDCSDNAAVGSCSNLSASFMVNQPLVVAADNATYLTTMVASAAL